MPQAQQVETEAPAQLDRGPAEGTEVQDLFTRLSAACDTSTFSFADKSSRDLVQSTASSIINGNCSWDRVSANLSNLQAQGKLSDIADYFSNHFSQDVRTLLVGSFPEHTSTIDKFFGKTTDQANTTGKPDDPMLGGLSREQLQTVHSKFPALKGVIKPEVLGAIIQNETDNTYNWKDTLSELPLKTLAVFDRNFGKGDGTAWISSWNMEELRNKVKNSDGTPWYQRWANNIELKVKEAVLAMSVGDAQIQVRNILSLQEQERAAGREVPKVSTSFTPEGSANLVAAYFTKSIELLSNNQATDPKKNPFLDSTRPSVVRGFKEAQDLWNSGDPVLRERAVMMTYNAGISNSDPEAWNPERILKHYLGR